MVVGEIARLRSGLKGEGHGGGGGGRHHGSAGGGGRELPGALAQRHHRPPWRWEHLFPFYFVFLSSFAFPSRSECLWCDILVSLGLRVLGAKEFGESWR
jgi:hypothetical protein